MPTAQQDTEITLGTGRMLAIFFTLVLVCAFFFAIGFSLGRKTTSSASLLANPSTTPATIVRPATKSSPAQAAAQSPDFGFYKAVGQKSADGLTPTAAPATTAVTTTAATTTTPAAPTVEPAPKDATDPGNVPPAGSYFVQVAAVSRQEDAESLVEALKKKQYPAFSANNAAVDKFYRVQVGPYPDQKSAEAMRARLIGDGYNPIVKK
jgi:DedD protein